jgi:hypothetical protein
VPLPERFNDYLREALPGFPGNRLGQTMGFRIFDVEAHGRSPLLENPLQFYHSYKTGFPAGKMEHGPARELPIRNRTLLQGARISDNRVGRPRCR